jgi:signal transduction histidine kinase
MHWLLFLFILVFGSPLGAQTLAAPEDSLENALPSSAGQVRADLLNKLSEEYKVKVPAKAFSYGQQALLLATRLNYQPGVAAAFNNLGEYYLNNGNYGLATENFQKALSVGQSTDNKVVVAVSLAKIGVVFYFQGQYDKALLYAHQALPLLEKQNLQKEWAEDLSIISYIHSAGGNTQKALDYSLRALRIRQKMQNDNEIAKSLNSIGDFYLKGNNLARALQNYRQALQVSRRTGNRRGIAFSMNNIGNVYSRQGEHQKALTQYQCALKLSRELGNQYQTAVSLANIGGAWLELADFGQSRRDYQEALVLFERLKNQHAYCSVLNQIGNTYSREKKYREALQYHGQALAIASAQDSPSKPVLMVTYKALADVYLATDQPQAFIRHYRQYDQLHKEQERHESKIKIAGMQAEFEEEENQKKLDQLNEQKRNQAQQLSRQKTIGNFLIVSIALAVGLLAVLLSFYRLKNQSNKRLLEQNGIISRQYEELNEANNRLNLLNTKLQESESELRKSNETKDKFFSIIAHDLRSPLATFTAFLSVLSSKDHTFTTEQITEVAIGTEKSLRNLSALLNNLLQWSQSQMGHTSYDPEAVWLHDIVQQTVSLLNDEAENKQIRILASINHDLFASADRNMLSFVLRNLIFNAIKFTPKHGTIGIDCDARPDNQLLVTVWDTGVGIRSENLEKLFRMNSGFTTRGTQNESGTGLGLLLCKEFVEKNGGLIWVESEVGNGSRFSFTIPRYLS